MESLILKQLAAKTLVEYLSIYIYIDVYIDMETNGVQMFDIG